jgi:hypothetical protein
MLLGLVLAATLGVGVLALGGCEGLAAQKERAIAERVLAEAQAYEQRQQANTEAYAEQTAIREAAKEASHQRAMEALPYVAVIAVSLTVACLGVCLTKNRIRQHPDHLVMVSGGSRETANPMPRHVTKIVILPSQSSSESRVDYWRRVEAAALGQGWTEYE